MNKGAWLKIVRITNEHLAAHQVLQKVVVVGLDLKSHERDRTDREHRH